MRPGIVRAALLVLACAGARGQSVDAPAFEVASVKPTTPEPNGRTMQFMRGGPGSADPGRIAYTGTSLKSLVMRAYDVKSFQVTAPAWLETERFDIAAKIPAGTTKEQFNMMLQGLLAERFHLAVHHESKELQGYELVVGKNGPKLKASADGDAGPPGGPPPVPGPPKMDAKGFPVLERAGVMMNMRMGEKGGLVARLTARAQTLSSLVMMLGGQLNLPVTDKTGLTGKYDFTLEYAPEGAGFGMPRATPPAAGQGPLDTLADSGPTMMSAIQEQLGLKLNPKKAQFDILIVDRVDKVPTEN